MLEEARKCWNLANQITAFAVATVLVFIYAAPGQLAGRLKNCVDWSHARTGFVVVMAVYAAAVFILYLLERCHLNDWRASRPEHGQKITRSSGLVFAGRCMTLVIFAGPGVWSIHSVQGVLCK